MVRKIEVEKIIALLTLPLLMMCHASWTRVSVTYVYIIYMAIVAVDICMTKKIEVPRISVPFYLSQFIFWFLLPLAIFHIDTINAGKYVFLLLLFSYTINLIGRETVDSKIDFIRIWAIFAILFCAFQVSMNLADINSDTIWGVLFDPNSGEQRIRAYFGFYHPNSTAFIILTAFFLQYIMFVESKFKKIYIATMLLCIVPLMCTGSRTAFLALIAFLVFELFLFVIKRADKGRVLIIIGTVILLAIIIIGMDFSDIDTKTSGRMSTIIESIKNMYNDNTLFFGALVRNISGAKESLKSLNLEGTDNAYFSIILRFGIFGLVSFLAAAVGFVKKLYDESIKYGAKTYCISLFVMLLVYSMGENILINQSTVLCFLVWVMLFRQIYVIEYTKAKKLGSQEKHKKIGSQEFK